MDSKARVAEELSKSAKISVDQAKAVLTALHFDKLVERVHAIEAVASDPRAAVAIGMLEQDVADVKKGDLEHQLSLANLRLVPSRHARMAHSVLNVLGVPK